MTMDAHLVYPLGWRTVGTMVVVPTGDRHSGAVATMLWFFCGEPLHRQVGQQYYPLGRHP